MATVEVIRSASFPDLDDEQFFPRLSEAKLEWLGKRGKRRTVAAGEVLYEHAVRDAPFFVLGPYIAKHSMLWSALSRPGISWRRA